MIGKRRVTFARVCVTFGFEEGGGIGVRITGFVMHEQISASFTSALSVVSSALAATFGLDSPEDK